MKWEHSIRKFMNLFSKDLLSAQSVPNAFRILEIEPWTKSLHSDELQLAGEMEIKQIIT